MRVEVWNCRGLGQRLTVRRLKEMQRLYHPDLLFLIETKQANDVVRDIGVDLGFDHMILVPPIGYSGGLAVFWKSYVSVSCISSDERLVDLHVEYQCFQFYLSCVYGHPQPKYRHLLWERLQRIATTRVGPWMLCGDCNEITKSEEKIGGRTRSMSSFQNFNTMLQICDMKDLKHTGNQFSWVGRRRNDIIECCLDRVMVNPSWMNKFPNSSTEYLEIAESDHRPMIVSIDYKYQRRKGLFCYDKRLFEDQSFVETVSGAWDQTEFIRGWNQKLGHCRNQIVNWKRRHQTNSAVRISVIRGQIDQALRDSSVQLEVIQELRVNLNKAYRDEEEFWKLKSRNRWLNLGDRNTPFYHGVSKVKKSKNKISKMRDKNGVFHIQEETIAKVAEDYFESMFSSTPTIPLDECLPNIQPKITMEMNAQLIAPVTDREIKDALDLIGADRAPGPDGFTAAFYKQFWDTIGPDVCNMVRRFFESGIMDNGINHTNIVLLPKFPEAADMGEYRPISLCTVAYKLISKVLDIRIQRCLDVIISESQAAFVPGRQISDNILVAHELISALKSKKDCSEQYMAIKTDISKAYDRVEWSFLESIMTKLGFHPISISWIMSCITTVSYSVLINGCPYGMIKPSRGIRQGDTLSPYLFLLCAEALSQMIDQAQITNRFQGMKLSRHCPKGLSLIIR